MRVFGYHLIDDRLQILCRDVFDVPRLDPPPTLQNGNNCRLAIRAVMILGPLSWLCRLWNAVTRLAADIGFIYLYYSFEL